MSARAFDSMWPDLCIQFVQVDGLERTIIGSDGMVLMVCPKQAEG